MNLLNYVPTCSRALSAPRALVPHVPRTLRALVPYVPCALRALVSHMPRASNTVVPNVPRASRTLVSCVPRFLCALVSYMLRASLLSVLRALCPMCTHALWALFCYVPLAPCTLSSLYANITFCALEFLYLTLLFFCSFRICDFVGEFTQVRTNIVCQ